MNGELMVSEGFAEIVLIVRDVRASARFYRDVVGLTPLGDASSDWAWFEAGDPGRLQRIALHRGSLLFEEHSPLPHGEHWGPVHFAFLAAEDQLEAAATRLRANDVTVYGPVQLEWKQARSYYFYDPDGNLLEFIAPRRAF
ncbi:MAG TPA: VOC family protein [Nitrolancea sp.]|jgi:catechol 2,3-dioxygenase-like lactoylglutathione lyase family enzyme|nr:VOC family protein [Nitrolancea sp.]